MAELSLKNIEKFFDKSHILKNINLTVDKGEFVVLVGPSGCGKSTLLRLIAGLEEVSSGKVFMDDKCVNNVEPKDRDIAMVFQNYALYPHMNVYKNMSFGLKNRKFPKAEIKKRVTQVAKILQLEELLYRKPSQLSGGQRQRVAMGRALVRKPKIFLFDEPLSNLDAKLRTQMRVEIKKLQRQMGITCIYVTHDQTEAMTLADKLVVLNAGCIEQVGSPSEIYSDPKSKFVAGFMGSPEMNFIPVSVGQDHTVSLTEKLRINVNKNKKMSQKNIFMGFRPEHLYVGHDHDICFILTIELIESLGSDILLHGKFYDKHKNLISKDNLIARIRGNKPFQIGEDVELSIKEKRLYFFDDELSNPSSFE